MNATDLVGTTEIAERAGVVPSAVSNWHSRYVTFPQPVTTIGGRPAWLWTEVERWINSADKAADRGQQVSIGTRLNMYQATKPMEDQ